MRRFTMRRNRFVGLLLVSVLAMLPLASGSSAAPGSTVLARGTLPGIPPGDFMFRIIDLTLEAKAAAITHMHGAGMNYAVSGPHLLTEAGQTRTLDVGQAAWGG